MKGGEPEVWPGYKMQEDTKEQVKINLQTESHCTVVSGQETTRYEHEERTRIEKRAPINTGETRMENHAQRQNGKPSRKRGNGDENAANDDGIVWREAQTIWQ